MFFFVCEEERLLYDGENPPYKPYARVALRLPMREDQKVIFKSNDVFLF